MSIDAARVSAGVAWLESQGLDLIRVHYPTRIPTPTNQLGVCSCRSPYKFDENGRPIDSPGLCKSPGKHPADRDWMRGRKIEEGGWDACWNVGLLTGREHGVIVLDVDPKNGGMTGWSRIIEACPWLDMAFSYWTSTTRSGERGFHIVLKPTEDAWESLRALPNSVFGVDIKDSGMVVTVPSQHATGESYEFRAGQGGGITPVDAVRAQELSGVLRTLASESGVVGIGITDRGEKKFDDGAGVLPAPQQFRKWLMGYEVPGYKQGERNNGMTGMIGAVVLMAFDGWEGCNDKELLEFELRGVLEDPTGVPPGIMHVARGLNATLCQPPLEAGELETMVHNLYRRELEKRIREVGGQISLIQSWTETANKQREDSLSNIKSRISGKYGITL